MRKHRQPAAETTETTSTTTGSVAERSSNLFDERGNEALVETTSAQVTPEESSRLEGLEGGTDLDRLFREELTVEHAVPTDPFRLLASPAPDWNLFIESCTLSGPEERRRALATVRHQGRWDGLVQGLDADRTQDIQSWMEGSSDEDFAEQLAGTANAERGQRALDAVGGLEDPQGRLTDAVKQMLALGVGQAANQDELGREGLLTVNSATAAAEALLAMDEAEYRRALLLLESAGSAGRDAQQHVLLEAMAARRDAVADGGTLEELESFSDSIRSMDRETLVDATSVAKTSRGDEGLQHKFRRGHAAGAVQFVAAEADPIKALAIDRSGGEGRDALDTDAAHEQEQILERHSDREAVARVSDDVIEKTTRWLTATQTTAEEKRAIEDYVNGRDYDAEAFERGLPQLERALGLSFPGAHAIAMARESQLNWSTEPMDGEALATEAGAAMGAAYGLNAPAELQEPNPQFDPENVAVWQPYVQDVLAGASQRVADGEDVLLQVTHGSGRGHTLTLTNVDEQTGRWLVHNTSNGKTAWVDEAAILEGRFNPLGIDPAMVSGTVTRNER